MPPAPIKDPGGVIGGLVDAIPGLGSIDGITDAVNAVRRWMSDRHNWTRVAWFGAGTALFVAGAVVVSGTGSAIVNTAKKVA